MGEVIMQRKWIAGVAISASLFILSGCQKQVETREWETMTMDRVSVHDPSIESVVVDGKETFYIFGSHLAEAKSTDLIHWEVPFQSEYENPEDNLLLGNLDENLKESFEWAGKDDADSSGGYSIWAPDVIWNADYVWQDGGKGAFMYYYSATSTWRRSCIGFAVSKTIEGPYQYADTIVYSGFSEVDSTDGSERNIQYEQTNLKELIQNKTIKEFSSKWVRNSGQEYNTDYAPNAIDPTLFYDENGKLWMTYGSWSGGVYLLEMDGKTGRPIYPGEDDMSDGKVVDRYFGTKLSGGFHQSGEGPYILYDKESGYYYLYVTYGQLSANGGYNMRMFRSASVEGPYVDAKGNSPVLEKGEINSDFGIKVMGNYKFSTMLKAYKSAGHNSAIIREDGAWMLVYHTRFSGSEAHEVRVHPMMLNQDQWPVTLPFEYQSDEYRSAKVEERQMIGSYEFINHGTDNAQGVIETQTIQLNEDYTITGDCGGTWQRNDENFVTITFDNQVYKGVVTAQLDEENTPKDRVVFSAIGENNESIWGVKSEEIK